jgi:SRSO17 transposase
VIRNGEKGPLKLKMVKRRVMAKTEKRTIGTEELLVATRRQEEDGTWKHDYFLSNAPCETSLKELGRVIKGEHRIEDSLKRAKSEAGLADYEVRTWQGWHHHQVLSLTATWFLIQESLRGREWTPAMTVPQVREGLAAIFHRAQSGGGVEQIRRERMLRLRRNELTRFYHWKQHNLLAPLRMLL